MKQLIKDTAVLGTALWLIGYLASLVLFFTPYAGVMGWILLAVFTPVTIVIAFWWFRKRERLPLQYYAGVGVAWVLIAIVLDYLFIVLLFQANYYGIDVFVYYAVTFFIPVGVGLFLNRFKKRERLPLQYYAGVGVAWVLIAIVLDYLFIVLLFQANYYGIDVFVYYAVTFLIPVGVGLFLNRNK